MGGLGAERLGRQPIAQHLPRRFKITEQRVRDTQEASCLRVVRRNSHRFEAVRRCLFVAPLVVQHPPEVIQHIVGAGRQPQGLQISGLSQFRVVAPRLQQPQIVIDQDIAGCQISSVAVGINGLIKPFSGQQHIAQIQPRTGIRRNLRDRAANQLDRRNVVTLLVAQDTQIVQRIGLVWDGFQNALVNRLRFVPLTMPLQMLSGSDRVCQRQALRLSLSGRNLRHNVSCCFCR